MNSYSYINQLIFLIDYVERKYALVDIRKKRENRKRGYQKIILDEVLEECSRDIFQNPIDIFESYLILYYYYADSYNDDIYKDQLDALIDVYNVTKTQVLHIL